MVSCILHTCAVVWRDMGVWLVLLSCWGSVSKSFERFWDKAGGGEVHLSFVVVPVEGDAEVSGTSVFDRDFIMSLEDAC